MALQMGKSLLRRRLKEAKMTQRAFSKKLGVKETFISMVIKGERSFSFERAVNAAEILDCRERDLNEWREVPLSEMRKGDE